MDGRLLLVSDLLVPDLPAHSKSCVRPSPSAIPPYYGMSITLRDAGLAEFFKLPEPGIAYLQA